MHRKQRFDNNNNKDNNDNKNNIDDERKHTKQHSTVKHTTGKPLNNNNVLHVKWASEAMVNE
jgi:hypothetical protein